MAVAYLIFPWEHRRKHGTCHALPVFERASSRYPEGLVEELDDILARDRARFANLFKALAGQGALPARAAWGPEGRGGTARKRLCGTRGGGPARSRSGDPGRRACARGTNRRISRASSGRSARASTRTGAASAAA